MNTFVTHFLIFPIWQLKFATEYEYEYEYEQLLPCPGDSRHAIIFAAEPCISRVYV